MASYQAAMKQTEPSAEPSAPNQPNANQGRIARNATTYLVTQMVSWCVTFLSVSIIPRHLGEAAMGQATYVLSMHGIIFGVLTLSIESFLVADIGRRPENAEPLLRAALGLRVCLFPIFVVCFLIALWLSKASPIHWQLAMVQIIIGSLTLFADPMRSVQAGREEAKRVSLTDFLLTIYPLFAIPFLKYGPVTLFISALIMVVIVLGTRTYWLSHDSHIRLMPRFDRETWKYLLRGGLPFYTAGLVMYFYGSVSVFSLHHFGGDPAVGVYSQALKLQGSFLFVATALSSALLPSLTRLADADDAQFHRIQNKTLSLLITLGLPLTALICILATPFCQLLYGTERFKELPLALQMSGLKLIPLYITTLMYQFLVAKRKGTIWNVFLVGTVIINAFGCFLLIPYCQKQYHNPAMGATLASLIAEAITVVFAFALLKSNPFNRETGIQLLRAGVATAAMCAVMIATIRLPLIVPAISGCLTFGVLGWWWKVLGEEEQQKFANLVQRKLLRRHAA